MHAQKFMLRSSPINCVPCPSTKELWCIKEYESTIATFSQHDPALNKSSRDDGGARKEEDNIETTKDQNCRYVQLASLTDGKLT